VTEEAVDWLLDSSCWPGVCLINFLILGIGFSPNSCLFMARPTKLPFKSPGLLVSWFDLWACPQLPLAGLPAHKFPIFHRFSTAAENLQLLPRITDHWSFQLGDTSGSGNGAVFICTLAFSQIYHLSLSNWKRKTEFINMPAWEVWGRHWKHENQSQGQKFMAALGGKRLTHIAVSPIHFSRLGTAEGHA